VAETEQDRPPSRVRQGRERLIEHRLILNHTVQ
jgi:hypothetical protein